MGEIDKIKDKNRIITQADYDTIKARLLVGDILLIHNKYQDFVYPHVLNNNPQGERYPVIYSNGERIVLPDCIDNISFSDRYVWTAYWYNDYAIIPSRLYSITMKEFEELYKKCKRYNGFK